jgi:type 1 glutamine amidotransferase
MRHILRPAAILLTLAAFAPFTFTRVETQPAPARKKLLFLTHAGLYKHPSLEPAEKALLEYGKTGGFDVTTVEGFRYDADKLDMSFLTPEYMAGFDGIMLMTNGNLPFTDAQKKSLVDYVRNGKAIIGAHCATLTLYDYPEFGEMLGGYYLRSIVPMNLMAQGKIGVLKVEDPTHPATRMLGTNWPVVEEFYQFGTAAWDASKPTENLSQVGKLQIPLGFSRDRVRVLLSLDTERTDISNLPQLTKGGDYPQAWSREFGKGRIFYTSLGHREDIWGNDRVFRAHVTGGIRWALRLE